MPPTSLQSGEDYALWLADARLCQDLMAKFPKMKGISEENQKYLHQWHLFNTKELSNWATGCCPFAASDLPQTGSELNVAQAVAVFNFYRRCVESFPTVEQLEEELRSLDR